MVSRATRTVTRKLAWGLGAVACVVLVLAVWMNYSIGRHALVEQADAEAIKQIRGAARELDDFVARIGMLSRMIAARQRAIGPRPDPGIVPYLAELLREVPAEEVYGVYLAFDGLRWDDPSAMPWIDRRGFPSPSQIKYDYHDAKWDWYNAPKQTRRFHVTEPYYDDGGSDITMVSLTAPIVAADGQYIGTAGADLSLDRLMAILKGIRVSAIDAPAGQAASEYTYVVSRAGKIIAHPDAALMLRKDYPGKDVGDLQDGALVTARANGSGRVSMNDEMRRVYWGQAPLTGWKVVLNVPEAAVLAPVKPLALRSAAIAVLGVGVMVLLIALVSRRLTAPSPR